jgi:hypothetical protein
MRRKLAGAYLAVVWSAAKACFARRSSLIVAAFTVMTADAIGELKRFPITRPGAMGIGQPQFQNDFTNVIYDETDYDADLGMPVLHTVQEKVEFVERESVIPPDIHAKYANANFWLKPDLNRRKVAIL